MSYNADAMEKATEIDHVRMRPGVYLGDEVRNTAIREIFDNSVDEVVAGYGNHVRVRFYHDGSIEVTDSGRGVPVDNDKFGENGIVKALGSLRSGGKFNQDSYAGGTQAGLNGIGAAGANAISARFSVRVYRDGKEYSLDFKEGLPGHFEGEEYDPFAKFTKGKTPHVEKDNRDKRDKELFPTGTSIRLTFDDNVAEDDVFDKEKFIAKISYYPYLVENLILTIVYEDGKEELITGEGGIPSLLDTILPPQKLLAESKPHLEGKVFITRKKKGEDISVPIEFEVSLGWEEKAYDEKRISFVNSVNTQKGVHETSFSAALEEAIQGKIASLKILKQKESYPLLSDIVEGLRFIVSIKMPEPPFTGQDKYSIRGNNIYNALKSGYLKSLNKWLSEKKNQEPIKKIAEKIVNASRVRALQTITKNNARKKNMAEEGSSLNLPMKLVPCASKTDNELFIVEGDSAKEVFLGARDADYQAVWPIKGKINNIWGMSLATLLSKVEVGGIFEVVGGGAGKNFDIDKMNYDRIILAADADKDGFHILSLLLSIFYSAARPIIEQGRLFIALPPLFVLQEIKSKKKHYAVSTTEREALEEELRKKKVKYHVVRLKGLGEMQADEFWDTVLNRETRNLKRVDINDVEECKNMLEIIFGNKVPPRREWIETSRDEFDSEELDR